VATFTKSAEKNCMTVDSTYPFKTYVDGYYNSCLIRDLISGRGARGGVVVVVLTHKSIALFKTSAEPFF